ncbi:hypothetical protein OC842_000979 [Tilletia horrida]|uniref:Uncharacterized protein n=1 Tax=Tilletia horrida TaxID=155126 RepID=A0AAN6JNZ3_9BASI|nr:hypothetical protein OC842_000979 [Tilletia horrida]
MHIRRYQCEDLPAIDPRQLDLGVAPSAGTPLDGRVPLTPLKAPAPQGCPPALEHNADARSRPPATDQPAQKTRRLDWEDEPSSVKAVREPTTKSVVRTYLNEQGQSLIATEVASVLKDYSTSVNGFRSRVLAARRDLADCDSLIPADDGYVYLRINETDLSSYLRSTQAMDKRIQALTAALGAATDRVKVLEGTVETLVEGGSVLVAASTGAGPPAEVGADGGRVHKWAKVQNEFRTTVARMAGLVAGRGAGDSADKIYDFSFPSSPAEWTLHPDTYEPTAADIPVPASELPAGSPKRYRCLRLDFGAAWDAEPNRALLMPILRSILTYPAKHDIPADFTPNELWDKALKRTWANWVKEANRRAQRTAEELQEENTIIHQKQRRYHRLKQKVDRRTANAAKAVVNDRSGKTSDIRMAIVLDDAMHSDDYSDSELLPGASSPSEIRIRRVPAYRSDELGDLLRSFESKGFVPTKTTVDRGETFDLPATGRLPKGLPRWAVKGAWAEQNLSRLPMLVANRGPWTGPGSVASGPDAFGTGTYDRDACDKMRRGEGVVVVAYAAGPAVAAAPSFASVGRAGPSCLRIDNLV